MTTTTMTKREWTKTTARDIQPNDELRDGRVLSVNHISSKYVSVTVEHYNGNQVQLLRADSFESVHTPLDAWEPAGDGAETPFATRTGRIFLYCFNRKRAEHRYYDVERDIILDDSEADYHLTPPTDTADLY